jgi:hypothetical protein
MDTNHIAEKVGLEPFLVREIQDVSKDKETLKTFLEKMAQNYDSLNRALVTGGARVHLSQGANLNYAGSRLEDAVVAISRAGGIEISEPGHDGFYSRICPYIDEGSKRELVRVRDDAYFGHEKGAMEFTFNRDDGINAEVTVHPQGNIYVVQSVDKNSAVLLRDSHFWQELAQENGLRIEAIDPKYTDKSPVTPWYRAVDEQSGAVLTMGWRWRVDEIGVDFKNPVPAERLNGLFGDIQTTKYINGGWTSGEVAHGNGGVKSFVIHAHQRDDAKKYTAQLLEVARQG